MKKFVISILLFCSVASAQGGPYANKDDEVISCKLQRDWKKAVWRVPLHIALSVPFAAGSFIIPPIGVGYIRWRRKAEHADQQFNRDTAMKAAVDLYSQTALVRGVLRIYGVKP